VVERARTRWPAASPNSIAAALQTHAPEAAELYEVAGLELRQLAVSNRALHQALAEITTRPGEDTP
jgi:hypothetical protein